MQQPPIPLDDLDWELVRAHYDERIAMHEHLIELHETGQVEAFANAALAIGPQNLSANYSAAEHGLGPKVLMYNTPPVEKDVFDLAEAFRGLVAGKDVPRIIRSAAISYLAIGVGSELSCMVNPGVCWVANTRTIWTDLLIKHGGRYELADEELKLYRDDDPRSKMAYSLWADIHRRLDRTMILLAGWSEPLCSAVFVETGPLTNLWGDAVANALYAERHG